MVQHWFATGVVALVLASAPPPAQLGVVIVTPGPSPEITLGTAAGTQILSGELARELAHIAGASVEVVGRQAGDRIFVQTYRIVEVQGARRPYVGILRREQDGFVLVDGSARGIDLSVEPAMQMALADRVGARIWLAGDKLLSGQIKVRRYGLLRPAGARQGP